MKKDELLELLDNKNYTQIKEKLTIMNEVDVAELLDILNASNAVLIFRMLPKDLAVDVFSYFSKKQQMGIINLITDKETEYIIDELFFDDMVDLIEEMPANIVNKILENTKEGERQLINHFLKYPKDSGGSLMTIEYVDFKKTFSVRQALEHIKELGLDKETVYTCYVTDSQRRLEGFVSLRTLVTSEPDEIIEDIMEHKIIRVYTNDDKEDIAAVFMKYGFVAIPVVDSEERITGLITVDDIMEVIEQEATEDFQIMAGMSPSEDEYLSTDVFTLAKNRFPWLLILMITATVTGRIMGKYENVLASVVILSIFIPMLMDTGGNSGNQSSTLIIRGLATGEIQTKDWLKVFWKEFRVSLIVAVGLVLVNFFRLLFFEKIDLSINLVVSITLIITIVASKITGGLLPIIAVKLKLDPAIMAGPLITTIVDALSLFVYFSMASILLGI